MKRNSRTGILGAAVFIGALAMAAVPAQAGKDGGWHLSVGANEHATPRDVGLPVYPGSWQWKKDSDKDDNGSAHIWALLGSAGLKVAVMKLGSHDAPGRIAVFYRRALAKYGPILDCSGPDASSRHLGSGSNKLTCDHNDSKPGTLLFKAGKDSDQHIVAIKPYGHGSEIDLVFVQVKGFD